jgi:NTE family protein
VTVAAQGIRVLPRRTRVAVALGGGGARGYAHIGILEVLEERGYDVVSIAGSSMGALVGGLYAAGGMEAYADWVRDLTPRDVLRMYDLSPRAPGAIRAERIFARVSDILGDVRIENLPIDFTAVATDLSTGEERWFQDGPLDAAIRASVALPGFMTPVVIHGRLLADGGLLNPLPIAPTVPARADLTVAVAVSGRHRPAVDGTAKATQSHRSSHRDALRRTAIQIRGGDVRQGLRNRITGRRNSPPGCPTGGSAAGITAKATETVLEALPARLRLLDVVGLSLEAVRAGVVRHSLAAHPPDVLITVPRSACRTLDFHKAGEMIALGRRLAVEALDREEEPAPMRAVDGWAGSPLATP